MADKEVTLDSIPIVLSEAVQPGHILLASSAVDVGGVFQLSDLLTHGSDMSSTPDAALYPGPLHFRPQRPKPGEYGYRLKVWMDEVWEFTRAVVPEPVSGGTFFYCPWQRKIPGGLESCGILHPGWATGSRFRSERAYRRHYRKCHLS